MPLQIVSRLPGQIAREFLIALRSVNYLTTHEAERVF
jgi:hypothetical protein